MRKRLQQPAEAFADHYGVNIEKVERRLKAEDGTKASGEGARPSSADTVKRGNKTRRAGRGDSSLVRMRRGAGGSSQAELVQIAVLERHVRNTGRALLARFAQRGPVPLSGDAGLLKELIHFAQAGERAARLIRARRVRG
jgi:hypothetical protein